MFSAKLRAPIVCGVLLAIALALGGCTGVSDQPAQVQQAQQKVTTQGKELAATLLADLKKQQPWGPHVANVTVEGSTITVSTDGQMFPDYLDSLRKALQHDVSQASEANLTVRVVGPDGSETSAARAEAGGGPDSNAKLTEAVRSALVDKTEATTAEDIAGVASTANGSVTLTLRKTTEELTGLTGSDAAATAAGVGQVTAEDILKHVPEAATVTVKDAAGVTLATKSR